MSATQCCRTGICTPPPSIIMNALLGGGSVKLPPVISDCVTSVPTVGVEPSGKVPLAKMNCGDGLRRAAPMPPRAYGKKCVPAGISARRPPTPYHAGSDPPLVTPTPSLDSDAVVASSVG